MSKKNDSSNEQKSTTDAPRAASPMQSAPLTQKNKSSLPKSKENIQKVQQYHHQQKDEIEIYYKKLSEWLRGDVDKNNHTTFTFFERRLPDIFSAVLAIKRTEEESNHGVSANLTLNATAYKERLFEMWGKCKGDYNVTLSNFQTSHTTQIGEGSTLIGCTYQTEERLIDSVGEMFFYSKTVSVLMKCNVVNRSPELLIAAFLCAIFFACVGCYFLDKHKFNMALISIGVDYFQILGLLSSTSFST